MAAQSVPQLDIPPGAVFAAAQVMREQNADPGVAPQPWDALPPGRQQWWLTRAGAVLAAGLAEINAPLTRADT